MKQQINDLCGDWEYKIDMVVTDGQEFKEMIL